MKNLTKYSRLKIINCSSIVLYSIFAYFIVSHFTITSAASIKTKVQETTKSKKQDFSVLCPCGQMMPSCCTPEYDAFFCDCAPKPFCPICPDGMNNEFSNFHDSMLKIAMKDAYNQQDLAHKAKLQVELFQKAQDFAKEVGIQEMKAKQYARILTEATRKAQVSRAMMFQAANQVRILADKTIRAITPMRCVGPHCSPSLNPNPMVQMAALNTHQNLQTINREMTNIERDPYTMESSNLINQNGSNRQNYNSGTGDMNSYQMNGYENVN